MRKVLRDVAVVASACLGKAEEEVDELALALVRFLGYIDECVDCVLDVVFKGYAEAEFLRPDDEDGAAVPCRRPVLKDCTLVT